MRNIPVVHVTKDNLPLAWEEAVICTDKFGIDIKTDYDRKGDPPSKDCTMVIEVVDPMSEPRIHKAMPVGLEDLEVYRQEVMDGIHDDRVGKDWHYSYHERLFRYPGVEETNQMESIIDRLVESTYSRRAQAITWNVDKDYEANEPPCLQRVWCRIMGKETLHLNMNTHWRSRDAYKAAFMNMYIMTLLQQKIAKAVSRGIGRKVEVGRYVDISDSFHIYGSDHEEFAGFLRNLYTRPFKDRTYTTEFAQLFFDEATARLTRESS